MGGQLNDREPNGGRPCLEIGRWISFFFFLNFQFSQTNGLAALGNDSEKSPGHSAFSAARVAHWLRIATEFGQAPPWDDKGASAHACEKEL